MTEKSFFEELDKKMGKPETDFSYRPEAEKKGFPFILIGLGLVFVVAVAILLSEVFSQGEKTNEATLEETTEIVQPSTDEIEQAEKALENAPITEENVKPAIDAPEVPAPAVKKEVEQIKAPEKIETNPNLIKKPVKKAEKKEASIVTPTGWQVQLAAVSSRENANEEWNRLKSRHPILSDKQHAIFEKNIQGRIIYRLRVVGMTSQDSADKLCAELQTKGVSCLVMK